MSNAVRSDLSVHRTFVVQFVPTRRRAGTQLAGRVEHVASGRAAEFSCLQVLLDFFAAELRAQAPGELSQE
jgi:hypothetical protein